MKLISLNIEHDKHFDRFLPFLQQEVADVVCLQEVFEQDLPQIEAYIGLKAHYAPMTLFKRIDGTYASMGVALLTNHRITDLRKDYYNDLGQKPGELLQYTDWPTTVQRVLLSASIQIDRLQYRLGTTHFTWSAHGQADDYQRSDLEKLLAALSQFDDIAFCGDFNAPRGREIFDKLASQYRDNIPSEAATTLDQNLHRDPGLQYVVDGLFSTDGYNVSDVRIVDGLSDHFAVIGNIEKVS